MHPYRPTARLRELDLHRRAGMKTLAFTAGVVLLFVWIIGMLGFFAISSAFHAVLLAAILLFIVSFMRDRRSVI